MVIYYLCCCVGLNLNEKWQFVKGAPLCVNVKVSDAPKSKDLPTVHDNKGCDTGPIFCSKAKFTSASYSTENMCYICTKLGALFSKLCSDVFTIDSK